MSNKKQENGFTFYNISLRGQLVIFIIPDNKDEMLIISPTKYFSE